MAGRPAILKVDIIADARKVGPGVDQAESRLSKLGGTAKKVGMLAAAGLAVGLGAAAAAGFKMAQAAAEDEAAAARLANTLKNTTGATDAQVAATESWITQQGKALGVADDELRPALARLATATHDVGKAQSLASLAMDISAGTGKSLEQVSTALMKAQNGQVAGLSKLGVATKDASGQTLSLDQITGTLAKTYRGAASSAANTAAGRWGRLKLQFGEMQETIGAKLLPVGNKLAGWALNKMIPAAAKLGGWLANNLGPAFASVGRFITTRVVPAARLFVSWFLEKIVPGLRSYAQPVLNGIRGAFGQLSAAVDRNREPLAKLGTAVRKVAEFLAKYLLPVIGKTVGLGWKVMGAAIGGVIDAVSSLVTWIDTAIDKLGSLVSWIGKIHMPSIKIPGVTGSVGNLTTTQVTLVGRSPGYDTRRGFSTAALGGASWATVTRSAASLTAGATIVVDARTELSLDARASLADEAALARKLARVLSDHGTRLGQQLAGLGR